MATSEIALEAAALTLMFEIQPETSNDIYGFSVFVNCRLVLTRFPSRPTSLVSNAFPGAL